MGCPCELRFDADSKAAFSRAIEPCLGEIRRFEAKYSRYLPDSVTSAINRAAGTSPVRVDAETVSILKYAAVCHEQSDGLFDLTSGGFRHVWQPHRTTLPSQQELDACAAKVGWDKVQFSEREVFLPLPGMELDFGGVVKEYAADAAAEVARNAGIRHGLVNLGGDIRIVGPQADGRPWPIGIVHPTLRDAAIATLSLAEGAVTTSGGYERYVEIEERRYSHLIDPRTGWPAEGLLSVSVVASQTIVAGSVATVALLLNQADGLDWLERCGAPYLAVDSQLRCYGHLLAGEGGVGDGRIAGTWPRNLHDRGQALIP